MTVSGAAGTDLTVTGPPLTFTRTNWSQPQTVTVAVGHDADASADAAVTLTNTVSGGDYGAVSTDIAVTITDDDSPALALSKTVLTLTEGGAAGTYTVALATQPSADVTVTVSGAAGTDLTVTGPPLTFTTSNWSQPQTVTVAARHDDDAPADAAVTLTNTASGGDYGAVSADVAVTITDDDSPALALSKTAFSVLEGGAAGTYTVALATQPSADVTVTVSGAAGTDLTVTGPPLTFSTSNWNQPQTVTVTAALDPNRVADVTVTLTHTASGADYGDVSQDVTVTITRAISSDATLSALALSGVSFTPTFAPGETTYTASVAYDVSSTIVTATTNHAGASVVITPVDADAITNGHQLNLDVGDTVISVEVTAEDGNTTQTYTVTVTRGKATVTISADAAMADEGHNPVFTLTRSPSASDSLEVTVRVSESGRFVIPANEGDQTVTIPADTASPTYMVRTVIDNDAWDPHSTVTAAVVAEASSPYTAGSPASASTDLSDNDFPSATAVLTVAPATANEGGTVTVTLTVTTDFEQMPHADAGAITLSTAPDTAQTADYGALSATSFTLEATDFTSVDVGGNPRYRAAYTATVAVVDDSAQEDAEDFSVSMARGSDLHTRVRLGTPASQTVTIHANDAPVISSDATLSALSLSGVSFTPTIAPRDDIHGRRGLRRVVHHRHGVVITPTDADAITNGHQLNLDVGDTVISVEVTAEDGMTKQTYSVTVTRAISSDATLRALALSDVTFTPTFDSAVRTYTASVGNSVTLTTVTATTNHAGASVVITPADAESNTPGHQVSLDVGDTSILVSVTAADGVTQAFYGVTVTRSAIPTLTALSVSHGSPAVTATLTPAFDSAVTSYAASVPYGAAQVTVAATGATGVTATFVQEDETTQQTDADSNAGGHQVKLAVGENVIRVRAAQGDDSQLYSVTMTGGKATVTISADAAMADEGHNPVFTVTRSASASDSLAVTVRASESGTFVIPANEGDKTVTIPANMTSATHTVRTVVDDDVWDSHSTVTAALVAEADSPYTAGSPDSASTEVKDNDFPSATAVLTVDPATANEGDSVTVTLTVTTLSEQMPHEDGGTITLSTAAGTAQTADYSALSATSFTLEATDFSSVDVGGSTRYRAADTATVAIVDDSAEEDAENFTVSMAGGSDLDGRVRLGTLASLTVTIAANDAPVLSTDATLNALSLSGVSFPPTFVSGTTSYTANVANSVSSTTVTPTPSHAAAGVVITPGDADSITAGHQVNLDVGDTVISVAVTAEDGMTKQTYSVTVTRAISSDATLRALALSDVTFTPTFDRPSEPTRPAWATA